MNDYFLHCINFLQAIALCGRVGRMDMCLRNAILLLIFLLSYVNISICQTGNGNNWIIGYNIDSDSSGTIFDYNSIPLHISSVSKNIYLEGSIAVMSDNLGNFLFYSNGCIIADANHDTIFNGDSIGLGKLETSFCKTGGSPINQGIIALPSPLNNHNYFLFYTDLDVAFESSSEYFPLAPLHLYYATIYSNPIENITSVVSKNQLLITDTLSRGMIQAARHSNGNDWWIIMPESHSNCYYTLRLNANGIDSSFKQCLGTIWNDRDASGQAVFSPNNEKYCRFNYFNGLNIFKFNATSGLLSDPMNVSFGLDTFYNCGVAISPNSQYLYASAFDKLFQFDLHSSEIANSKTLICELITPPEMTNTTKFNQGVLAPDGKIYIGGTSGFRYLHVINKPNCPGISSEVQQYALKLASINVYGMPNVPNFQGEEGIGKCDTIVNIIQVSEPEEFSIYPNPFTDNIIIQGTCPFIIDIYDLFGRNIISLESKNYYNNIDMDFLNNGLYIYKIYNKSNLIKSDFLIKM